MALTRISGVSSSIDPLVQLREVVSDLFPHQGLALVHKVRRWSDRLLVLTALLMGWGTASSLVDRFRLARGCVVELYPTRKRPGAAYNGFVECLVRHTPRLLATLAEVYRKRLIERAGSHYRTFGFVVLGVDGTKIEVPRSDANLEHFDVANKKHAGPEMMLCAIFHVATRSLWSFARGVAKSSERALCASMLPCLPKDSLVLADAGFVGWEMLGTLIDAGHHFVIRAGANVKLLTRLGHVEERDERVYLWPAREQEKNRLPIVLRRVVVRDARGREMYLLTSVLDEQRLSDQQIVRLYAMRWHVEVSYRWLKCSLQGRKMLSTSPEHAGVELDWTMMSLWTLALLSLSHGVTGEDLSLAGTLQVVRDAMTRRRFSGPNRTVASRLSRVRRDRYTRKSAKVKRHWPKRSRIHRCKTPHIRTATDEEMARYQSLQRQAA
jgi:hypothetical protein